MNHDFGRNADPVATLNVGRGLLCDLLATLVLRCLAEGDGRLAMELEDVRVAAQQAGYGELRRNLDRWWFAAVRAEAELRPLQ